MRVGCGLYFNKHKRMRPREMWGDEGQAEALPKLDGTSGVRSSPRLHPSVSDNGHSSVQESPRKRQRTNKMALPSPRMATRASAKTEDSKPLDFAGPLFSPTTLFGTSPALPIPPDPVLGGGETEGLGDVDIENLLAQLANNEHGFDLDALFAGAASGDGGSGGQEMLDLLSAWEGASGSVTEQKDGTA